MYPGTEKFDFLCRAREYTSGAECVSAVAWWKLLIDLFFKQVVQVETVCQFKLVNVMERAMVYEPGSDTDGPLAKVVASLDISLPVLGWPRRALKL